MSFESAILFMSRHKVGRRAPVMMVLVNVGNRFLTVCEVAINMRVEMDRVDRSWTTGEPGVTGGLKFSTNHVISLLCVTDAR
jgi:hypothetical protein